MKIKYHKLASNTLLAIGLLLTALFYKELGLLGIILCIVGNFCFWKACKNLEDMM